MQTETQVEAKSVDEIDREVQKWTVNKSIDIKVRVDVERILEGGVM